MVVQELRTLPGLGIQRFEDGRGIEVWQPVRRIGEVAVVAQQLGYRDLADPAGCKVFQCQCRAVLCDDLPAVAVVLQTVEQPYRSHADTSVSSDSGLRRFADNCRRHNRCSTLANAMSFDTPVDLATRWAPRPNGRGCAKQLVIAVHASSVGAHRSCRYPASHRTFCSVIGSSR
jgi:hypothetical protein